jgi:Pyridine nucleotide-disulphide oxidoreductase
VILHRLLKSAFELASKGKTALDGCIRSETVPGGKPRDSVSSLATEPYSAQLRYYPLLPCKSFPRIEPACYSQSKRDMNTEGALSSTEPFDLVVIGCGPAGEKEGAQAAYFGKRVAVIERAPVVGGSCINTGTVPSKTLRESALYFSGL